MIDRVVFGDCRASMREMIAQGGVKVQMCVTSPPYLGLRDYGPPGQIGLEKTPAEYVAAMVEVFRLVRELLADDGVLWLNLGDSYSNGGPDDGARPKNLLGIPWRVALALQEDGWNLRQDIIWHKPNPMPESVTDRCTKSHEYLFLLSKNERYFWDAAAMREPSTGLPPGNVNVQKYQAAYEAGDDLHRTKAGLGAYAERQRSKREESTYDTFTRNRRSVWTVPTQPYSGAHFAVFPPSLIEPCILAGSRPGDVVLDPFMGSGTTAQVAQALGRHWLGCELNEEYAPLQQARTAQSGFVFAAAEVADA